MNGYHISIEKGNTPIILPARVDFDPQTWSEVDVGGCEKASIAMSGHAAGVWQTFQWLGHKIRIYDPVSDLVWWGHVSRVEVADGAFSAGVELDSMSNRIRVAYTYSLPDNTAVRGNTPWIQNDASVERYGIKELQHSGGQNITDTAAVELRDSLLDAIKYPIPTLDAGLADDSANGTIYCTGDFFLADWQYATELRGLEESNTSGGATVPVGYAFTQLACWLSDDEERELWVFNQVLDGLEKDMTVDVTGGNAGTYTIDSAARGEVESTTDTVSFLSDQDISDVGGNIGKWSNGDIINISGSASNNERRQITKVEDAQEIKVKPKSITTEADVPNVTITRGYSVKLVEAPAAELFSITSAVTPRGYQLAQSFQLSNNVDPWTCNTIAIRVVKFGNPTDELKVELRSGGATDPSANVLASDTIAASEIYDTRAGWYEFNMGNTVSLTYGTHYWIVVSRTGPNNGQSYYNVSIDEERPYTTGNLRLAGIGGGWHARPTDATMPFIVRGKELITSQIQNIITNYAQFIEGVEFIDSSTIETNQYREGDTTSLVELRKLLEEGVNGGRRYICNMTPERRLVVREEPPKPDRTQVSIGSDGQLRLSLGGLYPAGRMVAGDWVDVQAPHITGDALASMSPFFCARSEFDAQSGQTRVEPRRNDPFNIKIRQG